MRFSLISLYLMWCVIAEGAVPKTKNLYISRASGNDKWSCDQVKPCKTIWRAITLASRGDHIHLDGNNTDKDPYTCESGTSEHPGVYINKSLSLIGSSGPMPQIRCTEGTGLTFNGSDDVKHTNVTLSGIFVHGSFLSIQDSSANIHGCKFECSKGIKYIIRSNYAKTVSTIEIANSTFSRNIKCISFFVNSTKCPSQRTQVVFKLTNTSFDANILSNETCISFTESPHSYQSTSFNITLENVSFSGNKFSSKGLVFFKMENGNHNIHFQNVVLTDNSPLSGQHVPTREDYSECIVHGTTINISINSSTFKSQNARSLKLGALNISFQIYHSSFCGHRIEGKGGVIFLKGTDLCKLSVSNSSFANTTAAQGGAINIERFNVCSVTFQDSNFTGNTAKAEHGIGGKGGVIFLGGTDLCRLSVSNSSFVNTTADQGGAINIERFNVCSVTFQDSNFTGNTARAEYGIGGKGGVIFLGGTDLCKLSVSNSSFVNTTADQGGAINIEHFNFCSVTFQDSNFTGNTAWIGYGGAVYINAVCYVSSNTGRARKNLRLRLIVDGCRFIRCTSSGHYAGGSLFVSYVPQTIEISINNSYFVSNFAMFCGAIAVFQKFNGLSNSSERWIKNTGQIIIEHSSFLNNRYRVTPDGTGAAICVDAITPTVLVFDKVKMESNSAGVAGAVEITGVSTIKIHQSRFFKNSNDDTDIGGFNVFNANLIEVLDSCFDDGGGALLITNFGIGGPNHTSVFIFNTTFRNCSFTGGAIRLYHGKNVSLEVKRCRFVENVLSPDFGGAIFLDLAQDSETNAGCIGKQRSSRANEIDNAYAFPTWDYKSNVIFEDTTFERNTAGFAGGAVRIINGKVTFRNCHFIDNFAKYGGHIYTDPGSASLIIVNSVFRQTMFNTAVNMNVSKASLIYIESSGALKLCNTTIDATPYGITGPLLEVRKGRLIEFGKDNQLITVNCPVGSQMVILNFTDQLITQIKRETCKIQLTTLEFSCSACPGNTYSLQRGRALGSQVVPGFQCLPCPFGANCSQNIASKPNFWGFKETLRPPTLAFVMCPVGYCSSPTKTDFPEYNACHGNRSGELCGECTETYTETLYSTNCSPAYQCKDYWFWPVALLYVLLMALYFTFKPPIVPWIKRHTLWFKTREPENMDNNFDRGYLKIIFYFYQAANLLLVSSSTQRIIETKFIDIFVGLFNFQQKISSSGWICPFPGLTVVTKQLFSASHVFGTCLMICALYILHWGVLRFRGQRAFSVAPYIGGILQTMLLGYTTLASISFNLLRCVPISSEKRLFYDGNVVCFQWWQYILIAFICTFFVPFIFVLFWGSYMLNRRALQVGKFLLACCFPLPALLSWSFVFLFCRSRNAATEDSTSSVMSRRSVERVLYDSFKRPEDGRKLPLCWESVMIGRRLMLVVLKAFISDPLPRLLIMSLFCVIFLLHHAMTQPFRDGIANILETISLLLIVVFATANVFFASFLSLAIPVDDRFSSWYNVSQVVEIVILFAVPAVFGLLLVAAVLSQVCRLILVVCRLLWNVLRICFSWCCRKQDDEMKPICASTT